MERLSRYLPIVLLVLAALPLSGCEAIVGIFKAGVWTGVVMIVVLIAIVGFVATRIRG
jgi:hypothetical protein